MLKLMIADDEVLERSGLRRNLPWSELGIELVGVYENGKEAYEAICNSAPDILMTDIRMPVMDGLELAQKVSRRFPAIKIIFISGYEDFAYAKKAIDLNVCQYILKPFEIKELIEIIREIAGKYEEEKRNEFEQNIMKQKLVESMPLLKEKFFSDLLYGVYEDEDKIHKRIEFLGLPLSTRGTYIVNMIEIDHFNSLVGNKGEDYMQAFPIYLYERIKTLVADYTEICISLYEAAYAVVIAFNDKDSAFSNDYSLMMKLQQDINRYFSVSVTIGIGRQCSMLKNIVNSYKQSKEAVKQKFVVGFGQIIYYDDIGEIDILEWDGIAANSKNRIISALSIGNLSEVREQTDAIYHALLNKKIDSRYVQNVSIDVINGVSKVLLKYNFSIEEIFGPGANLIDKLLRFDTIFDIQLWMKNILSAITEYIQLKCNSKNRNFIEKIKNVIKERYAEDLSVADIASEVFLSAGYATNLFKRETGESIMDHLIRTRIEVAKKLLSTPGIKVYEVSEGVGYSNVAYFSALFKKIEGISPKEYSERFGKY